MGIIFALISMVFAGVNDFVFKEFTNRSKQMTGLFLSGVGLISFVVFGMLAISSAEGITGVRWQVCAGAGIASFLANVLFVRSYHTLPAGTGATIYRLNLVVVALMSFFWLREAATLWKIIGIAMGSAAVLTLGRTGGGTSKAGRITSIGLTALVTACFLRALMGILYKLASIYGIPPYELLAVNGAIWCLGGLIYATLGRETLMFSTGTAGITLLSGVLVCGITYFMLASTRFAEASIAIPITQMSFIVTCILGSVLHNEAFTANKLMAVTAAIGCVICLSQG
ncbi:MAG: EamA family transporter [Armatimonadota bacterium]